MFLSLHKFAVLSWIGRISWMGQLGSVVTRIMCSAKLLEVYSIDAFSRDNWRKCCMLYLWRRSGV